MQYSVRCSVAIHCMLVIALYSEEKRLTSQLLAKSAGCNAATIRGIFRQLQDAELICVRRGTGGAFINRDASQITLWDIYRAVQPGEQESLRLHANPYPQCPVGKVIHQVLEEPYSRISDAMREQMQRYTLQMLLQRYAHMTEDENTTHA